LSAQASGYRCDESPTPPAYFGAKLFTELEFDHLVMVGIQLAYLSITLGKHRVAFTVRVAHHVVAADSNEIPYRVA
jgi:hypothetical protein